MYNICYRDSYSLQSIVSSPKRRRHEVLFGGTDSLASKPTYPQNSFSPRISATLFWKCWIMQNLYTCHEKSCWNIIISGGTSPADFSTAGDASPVPPLSPPMPASCSVFCPVRRIPSLVYYFSTITEKNVSKACVCNVCTYLIRNKIILYIFPLSARITSGCWLL